MRKKIIIILLIVFAVFFGALVAIPLVFKEKLLEKTKTTINKQVNAEVNFGGFKLSLLRGFPKVSLELKNVVVTGKGEFQADTLLNIASARGKMSLMSLFRKSGMSIEEINLDQAVLKLVVGKTGNVNWDLALETAEEIPAQQAAENEEGSFSLQLEKIDIKNATVFYDDREMDMLLDFSNINLSVNGKMYGTSTELLGTGKVEKFSTRYGGITYISNVVLETTTRLNVDYEKMDISILENELLVNRLPLEVTGLIQMPSDSMFFDLALKSKESGFENFLALVPPDYEEYLKDITTSGSATVSGTVKGWYFDENYPAFDLKIDVADGNFKYASLPEEIKNIKADISVSKPQGILDFTSVWIKNAHAEVKNNPVDLTLMLKNPVSDLYFDGALVGTINFDQLKDALPLDSVNISGTIDANLFVKGNYSAIEKELYDQIRSDGMVQLDNFLYDSPAFTQKIMVPSGKLDFSPLSVNLSQFNMKVGQSDFNLSGKVYNYLNYILKDGILKGDLQLFSSFVNVNELLLLQNEEENGLKAEAAKDKKATATTGADTEETQESLAFTVPENVDFTFRSKISKAVFDRLPISNISGLITAQNGKLMLNGLNMNMLDGELKLTGSYENTPQNQPMVDMGFEILKFDIPQAYQSLAGFRKILPVAAQSEGKLSTT
ncbi:MAG: AsmA family protein, partial [Bacteroidia bacterium]|nr:AsmA family protein [Bacteroidia bacterium]